MVTAPYLIFDLQGSRYAVRAASVREILWLPELTPLEESPPHIVGVLNLRGKIIPVMDLEHRFGHRAKAYGPSDVIVILEADGPVMGVIANEVTGIRNLSKEDMEERPPFLKGNRPGVNFIEGVAKVEDAIVMLLNLSSLLSGVELSGEGPDERDAAGHPLFLKGVAPEEIKVFRERALACRQPSVEHEISGLIPLAVVVLSGEYFGVSLREVHEFSEIGGLKPVPCCPEHVLGNVNLRGNIVTMIDIRGIAGIPPKGKAALSKAIIFPFGGLPLGVAVEDVLEVIYLRKTDIEPMPSAVSQPDKYARGTARYAGRLLTLLDLPLALSSEDMIVNEYV